MGSKTRISCTIDQEQRDWLTNNPQINASGLLQRAINQEIQGIPILYDKRDDLKTIKNKQITVISGKPQDFMARLILQLHLHELTSCLIDLTDAIIDLQFEGDSTIATVYCADPERNQFFIDMLIDLR